MKAENLFHTHTHAHTHAEGICTLLALLLVWQPWQLESSLRGCVNSQMLGFKSETINRVMK